MATDERMSVHDSYISSRCSYYQCAIRNKLRWLDHKLRFGDRVFKRRNSSATPTFLDHFGCLLFFLLAFLDCDIAFKFLSEICLSHWLLTDRLSIGLDIFENVVSIDYKWLVSIFVIYENHYLNERTPAYSQHRMGSIHLIWSHSMAPTKSNHVILGQGHWCI